MGKGKKYREVVEQVDKTMFYNVDETINLIEKTKVANFDESVEVAIKLGIDPRQADQQIRSAVLLPHGTGKKVKVLVFAKGDKAIEAKEAGADYVGLDELVDKMTKENWLDFDVVIATPDVMSLVGKLGKILGPKGLMPSPKLGTVTQNVADIVKQSKSGRIEIKNDKGGVVHAPIGKVSFGTQKLKDNFLVFLASLIKIKPSSSKGAFFKKITVSNTMGPGISVDISDVRESLKGFEVAA